MSDKVSNLYVWAVTIVDMILSLILAGITIWRGIADILVFVIAVTLPIVAVGYAKGYGVARGLNMLIGTTLFVYFISVNYHLVILPASSPGWADMISVVLGTVLSIVLIALTLSSRPRKVL